MRVGILTGGGDCPGSNAVVQAFVIRGTAHYGFEVLGILDGWRGRVENRSRLLAPPGVADPVHTGGTCLGTSRTDPYRDPQSLERLRETWRRAPRRRRTTAHGGRGDGPPRPKATA
jgi:6-phosphofructokinase 1